MLLYHFPLTSSFENKGFLNEDFIVNRNSSIDSTYGKLASKSMKVSSELYGGIVIPFVTTNMTELSICFRFYLTTRHDWKSIFSIDGTKYIDIAYADFNMFWYGNGHVLAKNVQNKWNDLVMNFANDNLSFYLNGEKVYDYSLPIALDQYITSYITVGARNKGPYATNSLSDAYYQDIRIYDYALSQAEINEYSRAMVVHYPLQGNELNPSVLKDVSGFGNDATLIENVDYIDSVRYSKALHKGGSGENRSGFFANNSFFTPNKYTISFWTKKDDSINSNYAIARFVCTVGYGYAGDRVYYDNSTKKLYWGIYNADNQWLVITSDAITSEQTQWQFYTLTYDGTDVKLYRNGILCSTRIGYAMLSFYLSKYRIGIIYGSAFSDFRIYATALSAEDIKNLYNSPIAVDKQHQSLAFEFKENPLHPSKYWRTPTYGEMNYILNTRTNASNLKLLGRVNVNGTYIKGCFLLPDDWVLPAGISMTITIANFTTNSYSLEEFKKLENAGAVFFPYCYIIGISINTGIARYWLSSSTGKRQFDMNDGSLGIGNWSNQQHLGEGVRLCRTSQDSHSFGTSATTKIRFAKSNLQYHCTQHLWRFAEHSYDYIGTANTNRSDSYDGWIDLFGYGTSGVNYRPTQNSIDDSNYASSDIANTDNDWGINEIQSYDYNVKNFALNKNGIVQHNELRENDSEVNGCYNDKLITNELIEN